MVLELPSKWKDHKDYLAGLTSSYRQAAKKVFKEIDAAGISVDRDLDAGASVERLHALYLQVHENAALRPVTLSPGYLPALQAALGPRFRIAALRRGGEILGFVTTLKDGDTAVGYFMGFDRAASESAPLYLRLLHATVEDALAMGCRRLSLGRTALDPKSRLGARPVPMQVWVRHRLPWLNLLVRGIAGSVPHAEAPERNPFKEEKAP
jgi:predicted N-acyltransferase